MQPKILTVGEANMDLIMQMPRVPDAGEVLYAREGGIAYVPSGSGANCAVAAAKLGAASAFCARLGGDIHGQRLHAMYNECGVNTSAIAADPRTPTGVNVIMTEESGKVREVVYPGANSNLTRDNLEPAFAMAPDAVCLQFSLPEDIVLTAASRAAERKIPIILFSCPRQEGFPYEKLPHVEILALNEREVERLTGIVPNGENGALRALLDLSKQISATYYVIKMGNRGAFLFDGLHRQMISPYILKVVDPAGGGDAFVAAMTHAYLQNGNDISAACKYATAAAAITLMRPGNAAAFPTADEVNGFIARNGSR